MMKWAKYLEREIGSKKGYKIKALKINLTGSVIDLPDDCYRVIMLLPGDYEDQANAEYADLGYVNIRQDERLAATTEYDDYSWYWKPAEVTPISEILWEEVAEQLRLPVEYSEQDITIIYQYIETNEYGFWIINQSHADAITKYVKFKIAEKYNWKTFKSDKLLRQGHLTFVAQLERDYNIAVRHARAEDGQVTPFQKEQF